MVKKKKASLKKQLYELQRYNLPLIRNKCQSHYPPTPLHQQQMQQKLPSYQPPPPSTLYDGFYYGAQTIFEQRYKSFPRYEEKMDHRNEEYLMYQDQPEKKG